MVDENTDEDLIPKIDFKEQLKKIQVNRFKTFGKYKIDKWFIQAAMFICFSFLFFVAYSYNFNLDFFSCNYDAIEGKPLLGADSCKNPFYKPATWVNMPELPPGEYGQKPGFLFSMLWPVTIILFLFAFILNHFIYNKGFKFIPTEQELKEKGVLNNERDNDNE